MHGATNLRTPWGYLCIRFPTRKFGRWLGWHLYVSPNATQWAASWGVGPGIELRYRDEIHARRAARRHLVRVVRRLPHEDLTAVAQSLAAGEPFGIQFTGHEGTNGAGGEA
jgi:hypothetical protein